MTDIYILIYRIIYNKIQDNDIESHRAPFPACSTPYSVSEQGMSTYIFVVILAVVINVQYSYIYSLKPHGVKNVKHCIVT